MPKLKKTSPNYGQILLLAIVVTAVIMIWLISLYSSTSIFITSGYQASNRESALSLANAGIDKALWRINTSVNPNESTTLGTGQVQVTVVDQSQTLKTITATGCIPSCASAKAKRIVKADAKFNSTPIPFQYALHGNSNELGLGDYAIVNGNVHSNTVLRGSTPQNAPTINGAAEYVTLLRSTINVNPGPAVQSNIVPLPNINESYWITQATSTNDIQTCSPSPCTISTTTTIGPKKYVGNLVIATGAVVSVKGPVYVTGDIEIQSGATLKLDNSCSAGTVIIVDNFWHIRAGATILKSTSNPNNYLLLYFKRNGEVKLGGSNPLQMVLYVANGDLQVEQNVINLTGALIGDTITIGTSSIINGDSNLENANFSNCTLTSGSGANNTWQVKRGTYQITR